MPGVSYINDVSSNGISIISNVVPGNLEVVTTSFSPTLNSINLLISVDLPHLSYLQYKHHHGHGFD